MPRAIGRSKLPASFFNQLVLDLPPCGRLFWNTRDLIAPVQSDECFLSRLVQADQRLLSLESLH